MDLFENVLINLKVIGSLRPHDRLNTTSPLFRIHSPHRYTPTWFSRWWARQDRNCDISRIQNIYHTAQSLQSSLDNKKKIEQLNEYIQHSIKGLQQMKITYKDDPTIIATLEVIHDNNSTH